jgi:hypothetical protein
MTSVLLRRDCDHGAGGRDPAPLGALERQGVAADAEAVERGGDLRRGRSGVDEGAEQHVAGHAPGAVDVRDALASPRRGTTA